MSARDRLARLLGPAGEEVTCDACFDRLDRYVELERAGADADADVPGMRAPRIAWRCTRCSTPPAREPRRRRA
jgi:hypothetical protein